MRRSSTPQASYLIVLTSVLISEPVTAEWVFRFHVLEFSIHTGDLQEVFCWEVDDPDRPSITLCDPRAIVTMGVDDTAKLVLIDFRAKLVKTIDTGLPFEVGHL